MHTPAPLLIPPPRPFPYPLPLPYTPPLHRPGLVCLWVCGSLRLFLFTLCPVEREKMVVLVVFLLLVAKLQVFSFGCDYSPPSPSFLLSIPQSTQTHTLILWACVCVCINCVSPKNHATFFFSFSCFFSHHKPSCFAWVSQLRPFFKPMILFSARGFLF